MEKESNNYTQLHSSPGVHNLRP